MSPNRNNNTTDTGPFSHCYVVEYHFTCDAFSVNSLQDYLTHAHKAFLKGKFFDSIVLALHPTEQGAKDECSVWQERRNESPVSADMRLADLRRYIEGLETQL